MKNCNLLKLCCPCGEQTFTFTAAGLIENGRLCFFWTCATCRKPVWFAADLDQLKGDCPVDEEFTQEDADFLKFFHIKPGEEAA